MDNEKSEINVVPADKRDSELVSRLLKLWEASVRATHLFLQEDDIKRLTPAAREAICGIPVLLTAGNKEGQICGFAGIDEDSLEMLFIAPDCFGHGIGKSLLRTAIEKYGVAKVDVNEQNPKARGFYEHIGFVVKSRSEYDGYGNNFPILHMILQK